MRPVWLPLTLLLSGLLWSASVEGRRRPRLGEALEHVPRIAQPVVRAVLTAKRQVLLSWRRARAGTDGDRLFQAVLADVEARVRLGQRCVMVWDIDNTLVDTRYRTQAAARTFAAQWQGKRPPELERLASVKIRDVGRDAAETCRNLGIVDPIVVERFGALWERFFWYGENLHYDRRIGKTADMAWAAWWAGAENRYLTGRVETLPDGSEGLRLPTLRQLVQQGLPDARSDHLFLKPRYDGYRTPEYKTGQLFDWVKEGLHVASFTTDGTRDISYAQAHGPRLDYFRYAFPLDGEPHPLRPGTPVIPHKRRLSGPVAGATIRP